MLTEGLCASCRKTTFAEILCASCAGKPCSICGNLPSEIKQIDIGVAGYPVYCFGKAHAPYRDKARDVSAK